MTRACLLLLLLALAPRAAAQVPEDTWQDPPLDAAVADADVIVLGECTFVARGGGVSYKVSKTFKGQPLDGKLVIVIGFDAPGDVGKHSVVVGDRAYLLLRGEAGSGLSVPTPTFGRFPLHESGDVVGSFSDTFVRVAVPAARWERLLGSLVSGKPDPALLDDVRAVLAQKEPDPNHLYQALEVLALFGEEADRPACDAVLDDARWQEPHRFRLRLAAARVLARLGGAASATRLLALVEKDPLDVVKSAAAALLGPLLKALHATDPGAVSRVAERLAPLALDARAAPIRFGSAHDRRANQLDGVLGAILKTLGGVRARVGIAPALRALERVEDGDALVAGLSFFSALGDPDQAGAVAWRMRKAGAEDEYFNPLFVRTLEQLTGQSLGNDREAWVRWARERSLLPQGPEAPPR